VSVIIVSYNNLYLLKDCLCSLIQHTKDVKYEIIIIDNNSVEGDVKNAVSEFKDTTLIINKNNAGFAAANNQGIGLAKGKYFLFLNNDTIFLENTIKKIFDFAESLQDKTFIGCELKNADRSHQDSIQEIDNVWNYFGEKFFLYKLFPGSKLLNRYYQNYIPAEKPVDVDIIKGAFMFCDSKSVIELKGFDERFYFYGEEVDLCMRFKAQGGRILFYPMSSIIHLGGATVTKNRWFDLKNQVIARIQILQKHYYGLMFFTMLLLHYSGIFLRIWVYSIEGVITLNKNQLWKALYYLKQLFVYPQNRFKH
jgi:hypothetical protein